MIFFIHRFAPINLNEVAPSEYSQLPRRCCHREAFFLSISTGACRTLAKDGSVELKVALFALTLAVALPAPALELKPKWKPDLPIDIPRTVKTFAYYTNGKAPFVVFQHGTCVQLKPGSKAPEADAKVVLDKIYRFHVDFNPLPMDDGNWLISYPKPAYSIVFQDEVKKNRAYIEKHHMEGLVPGEVMVGPKGQANKFDLRAKIALLGRARLFLDITHPKVAKIYRPL